MDGKIGNVGKYEVSEKGIASVEAGVGYPTENPAAKVSVKVEVDVVDLLKEAAKHTTNTLDDAAVEMVAKALGR